MKTYWKKTLQRRTVTRKEKVVLTKMPCAHPHIELTEWDLEVLCVCVCVSLSVGGTGASSPLQTPGVTPVCALSEFLLHWLTDWMFSKLEGCLILPPSSGSSHYPSSPLLFYDSLTELLVTFALQPKKCQHGKYGVLSPECHSRQRSTHTQFTHTSVTKNTQQPPMTTAIGMNFTPEQGRD